jgi:hypothetical protein
LKPEGDAVSGAMIKTLYDGASLTDPTPKILQKHLVADSFARPNKNAKFRCQPNTEYSDRKASFGSSRVALARAARDPKRYAVSLRILNARMSSVISAAF